MSHTLRIKTENESLEYTFSSDAFWYIFFNDCYGYVSAILSPEELEIIQWQLEDAFSVDEYGDPLDDFVPVYKEPSSFGQIMSKIHKEFVNNPEQYVNYTFSYSRNDYEPPATEHYRQDLIAIEKCCTQACKDGCGIILFGSYY